MNTKHAAALDQSRWLAGVLSGQPDRVAAALADRHAKDTERDGQRAANLALADHVERYRGRIPNDADDDTLKRWADHYAAEVRRGIAAAPGDDPMLDYAIGHRICNGASIEPPRPVNVDVYDELVGCIARMRCKYWWRRKIRVAFGRRVEQSARALGIVRKGRDLYISADGWRRWQERTGANAQTLADSVAVADDGTELSLVDIAAAGVSNPRIRRAELMTRMRGLEQTAEARGDVALFVTWTTPPELHASHASGDTGEGRHVSPREGQAWLRKQWAKARAKLKRDEVFVYGLRVAEPHHDGTPHWHLLLFVPPGHLAALESTLTRYVLDGDTRDKRRRYGYEHTIIDRSKGSATGYVAKYIAKSIDAEGLDVATSRDAYGRQTALDLDPGEAANRVRAWASQWGIRQFQFIGAPPVGPWRELRRLEPISEYRMCRAPSLRHVERLRHAADSGDWSGYVDLMGGPCRLSKDRPARIRYLMDATTGRYGDATHRPYVEAFGRVVWTRPQKWTIEYRPGVSRGESAGRESGAPWTRGNNCTEATANDETDITPERRNTAADRATSSQRRKSRSQSADEWPNDRPVHHRDFRDSRRARAARRTH